MALAHMTQQQRGPVEEYNTRRELNKYAKTQVILQYVGSSLCMLQLIKVEYVTIKRVPLTTYFITPSFIK